MKNIFNIIAIVFVSSLGMAQTTTENYVKSTSYKVKTTDGHYKAGTTTDLTNDDKIESITYFDGLGRAMQTISKQAGGNKEHIIMPVVYDSLGRTSRSYLPYPSIASGSTALNYIDNNSTLIPNLETYYDLKYDEEWTMNDEINPYSETHFEFSPLNRVLEQGAPGNDWRVDQDNDTDHTIKFQYQTNMVDEVDHFSAIFTTGDTELPQLYYEGTYAANELYKTITKDENWQPSQVYPKVHTTEEFKNSLGQVVLKRTFLKDKNFNTHYVYDDFGNLTYVLSPEGSDEVLSNNKFFNYNKSISSSEFVPTDKKGTPIASSSGAVIIDVNASQQQLEVRFNFSFNTAIEIKNGPISQLNGYIPNMIVGNIIGPGYNYVVSVENNFLFISGSGTVLGVNEIFTVGIPDQSVSTNVINDLCYQYHYDKRNRLVEKKIPQKGWEYIVYDKLDRPILTQDTLQRSSPKEWLFTKYDQLDRVAYTGVFKDSNSRLSLQALVNNQSQLSETTSSTSIINGKTVYYSNSAYPTTNLTLYTVNYYDTYNLTLSNAFSNPGTVYGKTISNSTKSLATGSLIRVLGTDDWITSVSYYDDKGQTIYMGSRNDYLSTTDIIKTDLDFIGIVNETESSHTKGITNPEIIVTDRFTYDHASRLLTQKQQITGESEELIVKNEYDELGQMVKKDVGSIEESPLQSVDYTYNIRGWLRQINNPDAIGSDLFSFGINYNTTNLGLGNDALYNGNISETIWKTANDAQDTSRGYAYKYDPLNRIKSANMAIDVGIGFVEANGYHLTGLKYDSNGNIMALQRAGQNDIFDNLIYSYDGNQLTSVTDQITNQQAEGFIDGNIGSTDYDYDANGNMIWDKNKDITSINYNHLNLPTEVKFSYSNTKKINYIYDATGLKLEKVVNDNGNITNTEYAGNYIYENSTLKFFSHPEGYVEPDGNSFNYVYQFKDHLGNIRLSYVKDKANSVIIEEDYTGTTYDWSGIPNGGSILSTNDELNISITNKWNSTSKYVTFTPGEAIHIEFDFENVDMQAPKLFVREQINGVWEPGGDRDIIHLNSNGHYALDLNPAGDYIRIYFEKGNASDDLVLTSFKIDNLVITQNIIEIVEENNYYPFGLKHKGYNNVINGTDHKYGFGGKEEQDELSLGWIDITARNYDPAIGRWMNIDPATDLLESSSPYVYALNSPVVYLDEDGELPILINGRVSSDDERGSSKYWDSEIIATIKGSGIANPGGQIHYVDGDRGAETWYERESGTLFTWNKKSQLSTGRAWNVRDRKAGGRLAADNDFRSIIEKLERDPETGKITEKIQIYTHSRGGAFGEGYTQRLFELIKKNSRLFADANSVIEFSLNLAPHESDNISAVDGVSTVGISHRSDVLSGNDIEGAGNVHSNPGNLFTSHGNGSFQRELSAFLSAFTSNGEMNSSTIDEFKKSLESMGIKFSYKDK
jgi:RHS repeat-associated protein